MIDDQVVLAAPEELGYKVFVIPEQNMYSVAADRPLPSVACARLFARGRFWLKEYEVHAN